jgi:pyruvate kinase
VNRIRPGQEIWFDDGKIGGIVRERNAGVLRVEINVVRGGRRMLREDRGINVPGVDLGLEGFTEKDRDNLRFALRFADMVGLSFVHSPGDVDRLLEAMKSPAGRRTGFILKIENERAVHALDDLLLAAMRHTSVGVLVARGDLAVECGFARLSEIQDDILRRSHLAGLPVIWATEVLENLSRRGVPTRPELTDARKGLEADCILLGKGPYVQDAIRLIGQLDRRRRGRPRPDQYS